MSGDVSGCQNWEGRYGHLAGRVQERWQIPFTRRSSTTSNCLAPNASSDTAEKHTNDCDNVVSLLLEKHYLVPWDQNGEHVPAENRSETAGLASPLYTPRPAERPCLLRPRQTGVGARTSWSKKHRVVGPIPLLTGAEFSYCPGLGVKFSPPHPGRLSPGWAAPHRPQPTRPGHAAQEPRSLSARLQLAVRPQTPLTESLRPRCTGERVTNGKKKPQPTPKPQTSAEATPPSRPD
ncbi:uncharacterized protein LOC124504613 [Lynx rufus]|uniref:uncharacterized protein LOC124504613 n=1 Tax=Lynx rufus TaxID=61384 RepID=UPI001F1288EF|nr:uncharacterized protein LOC124504613 [Lynx rufus]